MNSKIKFFLLSMLVVPAALIFAEVEKFDDSAPVESTCETKSHKKTYDCLRVKKLLRVCGNEEVLGNLSVAGNTTLNNLAVNGDLSLTNSLVVNDIDITNATINNLTVTGSVVLPSPLTLGALFVESINLTATTSGQVGVPGIGGLLGYGQALVSGTAAIPPNTDLTFTTSGLTSSDITYSTGGLTVANSGIYRLSYQVRGLVGVDEDELLTFQLTANNVLIPNSTFSSDFLVTPTDAASLVVNGLVIAQLNAGDIVTLRNASADEVNLSSNGGISASLVVERIAA